MKLLRIMLSLSFIFVEKNIKCMEDNKLIQIITGQAITGKDSEQINQVNLYFQGIDDKILKENNEIMNYNNSLCHYNLLVQELNDLQLKHIEDRIEYKELNNKYNYLEKEFNNQKLNIDKLEKEKSPLKIYDELKNQHNDLTNKYNELEIENIALKLALMSKNNNDPKK